MLFNSQIFLLAFLPLALLLHRAAGPRPHARTAILVTASLAFYGYWDTTLLPLLAGSILMNWGLLRTILLVRRPRLVAAVGVALNLGLLAFFKYADFLAGNVASLAGFPHQPWTIVLPLAISFFTFEQISCLVDAARGQVPRYRLLDYALYVSFFPHLIAGPIVRHDELLPQIRADAGKQPLPEAFGRGLALLVLGLCKKVWIADGLGPAVDPLFAQALDGDLGLAGAWLAAAGFSFQIYFDFSAYSDMAIGLALLFGFHLPDNFNSPYKAGSIVEFWRRWHMTLSRFLRDYLYIPLGGSRHGRLRQVAATMTTMLLGGLWHGAGWTFILWGGLHGVALAINQQWRRTGRRLPAPLGWLLTMVTVFVGFAIFRATSLDHAMEMLRALAGVEGLKGLVPAVKDRWLIALAAFLALSGLSNGRWVLGFVRPARPLAIALGLVLALLVIDLGGGPGDEFIYFRF